MAKYDIDEDFKDFSGEMNLKEAQKNEDNLVRIGLVPENYDGILEDDRIFETNFVYCGMHHKVHSTGWCTSNAINKRPLRGDDFDEAQNHALELGLITHKL